MNAVRIGRFAGGGVRDASRRCVIETTRVDESRGVGPTTFSSRSAGHNDEADPCGARFVVAEPARWLSNPSWETQRLLKWIETRR
ncbi:hypothetical protein MTE01_27660 [Microbacterium testaceum]|uniref:Uncharacterized protein n=1 Tax=Microbacterium testaceum TaxID=2033 RepID=A0A4Y3QNX6_MICTE|nr:hypothetical protein MTE01_27660 [Microbacterium testaceum]